MSKLRLYMLGAPQAEIDGYPADIRRRKVWALLVYLAVTNQSQRRDSLATLLWPEESQSKARAALTRHLSELRKAVGAECVAADRETVTLTGDIWLDVHHFRQHVADCRQGGGDCVAVLQTAVSLYQADFLTGFTLPDCPDFDEWQFFQTEELRQTLATALNQLIQSYSQQADPVAALPFARRLLTLDPLHEPGHRTLMHLYARVGQQAAALRQYQLCRDTLADELGIEPSPETTTLAEQIRTGQIASVASSQPFPLTTSASNSDRPKHNLPQRLTSFIGREKEIAAVTDLVTQHRLVMLTGVGGIGKTNLSLQVGHRTLESLPDGVWFVELAPVVDPGLVPQATATALGLQESGNQTIADSLLDYLREKHCLLILDNCEHLINGAAQFVQTVLLRCANVRILASSREVLAVPGERSFQVPPLTLPQQGQQSILEDWQQYEAIRLFVERAQMVLPDFQVTADNAPSLVRICQRLDGIPLALELAAARVKVLTTAQISERLDDRFHLLTSGSRTALPRQQTLRALIDWSWELLTEDEQHLLQRLSIFAGGMNLEAVEAICFDESLQSYEIFDSLNELVNKSLVNIQRKPGEETRYYLLETIRQYALERLMATGELDTYRQNHLVYFQQLTETAEPLLPKPQGTAWLNQLEKELANIRTALDWAQERDPEAGIKLISSLGLFWWSRGHVQEMETRLNRLLNQTTSSETSIRAKGLWQQGNFTHMLSKHEQSEKVLQESLTLYRELGDESSVGNVLRLLGHALVQQGKREQGRLLMQESLTRLRAIGDKAGIASTLLFLSFDADQDDYEQRWAYLKESESLYRELDFSAGVALILRNLGRLATLQGDFKLARAHLEEGLSLAKTLDIREIAHLLTDMGALYFRLGDLALAQTTLEEAVLEFKNPRTPWRQSKMWPVLHLGYVHLRQGNLWQARQNFQQSLNRFKEWNVDIAICFSLEGLASFAVQREQAEKAARLFAWADATRKTLGDSRPPTEQADVDKDIAIILDMIDEETYTAVYAEGYAMTMDEAIALALNGDSTN